MTTMRTAPCAQCGAPVRVADDSAGTAVTCESCRALRHGVQPLGDRPPPGPFANAVQPGPPMPAQTIRPGATSDSSARGPSAWPSWEEFCAHSMAFRREMTRFAEDRLPNLDDIDPRPLPANTPEAADDLGEPIASFHISGESQWILRTFGAGCCLFGLALLATVVLGLVQRGARNDRDVGAIAFTGAMTIAIGLLLVFVVKVTPPHGFWI